MAGFYASILNKPIKNVRNQWKWTQGRIGRLLIKITESVEVERL